MRLLKLLKKSYVRIILYVLLFSVFGFLAYFGQAELRVCIFERIFGILCPGCGTTRAFVQLLGLNFSEAFVLNPFFCCFIFPCALCVFLQDIICVVWNHISKEKKLSFAEFVIDVLWSLNND